MDTLASMNTFQFTLNSVLYHRSFSLLSVNLTYLGLIFAFGNKCFWQRKKTHFPRVRHTKLHEGFHASCYVIWLSVKWCWSAVEYIFWKKHTQDRPAWAIWLLTKHFCCFSYLLPRCHATLLCSGVTELVEKSRIGHQFSVWNLCLPWDPFSEFQLLRL